LIGFGRDEKSGAYVTRVQARPAVTPIEEPSPPELVVVEPVTVNAENEPKNSPVLEEPKAATPRRRGTRRPRKATEAKPVELAPVPEPAVLAPDVAAPVSEKPAKKRAPRSRKPKTDSETPV
jgi:hypothetical protein